MIVEHKAVDPSSQTMDPDGASSLYYPSPSNAPSNAETTLSQRIIKTSMTKPAKKRVDKVTPKRCLITYGSKYLDYTHCLPRSTKEPLLDRLEFAWNMERFTLNVDTRYNIIRLSSTLHRAFDADDWLLLPETRIIDAYYNARNTRGLPDIDAEVYKYTLVPREEMWEIPIHRQKPPPPDSPMRPPPKDFFSYYLYPYHDFPTIESHVHPRFIICNSGAKLVAATGIYETTNLKDDLTKVQVIWNSWRQAVLTKEFLEKTSEGGDPDIEDDSSEKTTPRRAHLRRTPRHRKAAGGQDSPAPKNSKQQTLQDSGIRLDGETLHEFDRQSSSHNGLTNPKNQWIQDWLRGFSDSKCMAEVNGKLGNGRDCDDTMACGGGGHEAKRWSGNLHELVHEYIVV
ncbi:hypothetical protein EDB86DRAFT_3013841 [Lactarius hatsudake]|nr:hypothetical protein EDB86DRAFT_3013841 [Lactarius hatsudake]